MDVDIDKVYREPSKRRGKHESKMLGMDARGRAAYRAEVVGKLVPSEAWEDRGVRFEITRGPQTRGELVDVWVKAVRVSDNVPMPLSNPLRFKNPPLKVPDGTWRKVTGPDGAEVDVPNTVEDPDAALRAMIAGTAFAIWGREGWRP